MKREYRVVQGLELRQEPGERVRISGYAAVFNELSAPMDFLRERILPGAFKKALRDGNDIRAFNNHRQDQLIGRRKNKSLVLAEDDHGLRVDIYPPDTVVGRDVVENIRSGYLDQMSIGFLEPDRNQMRFVSEKGMRIRELLEIDLREVSTVAMPAYEGTSITARWLWPDGMPEGLEELKNALSIVPVEVVVPPVVLQPSHARKIVEELEAKFGLKQS